LPALAAWVGLGSNMESPARQLARGLAGLDRLPGTRLVAWSRAYRTRPWGEPDQPDFINAVARLETGLSPESLLAGLQSIENQAGRARDPDARWGPRILDLDLLVYDDLEIRSPELEIPHPRMTRRAFVLAPLVELDPELQIPGHGRAREYLAGLDDSDILAIDPLEPETGFDH